MVDFPKLGHMWLFVPLANNTINFDDVTNKTEWGDKLNIYHQVITNLSYSDSTSLTSCMVGCAQAVGYSFRTTSSHSL